MDLVSRAGRPNRVWHVAASERWLSRRRVGSPDTLETPPDGFKYFTQKGITQMALAPGEYVAEYENDRGIFYRGPARCLYQADVAGRYEGIRMDGGVFVPSSESEVAMVYWYAGSDRKAPRINETGPERGATLAQENLLVSALLRLEKGNIKFVPSPEDGSLRAALIR